MVEVCAYSCYQCRLGIGDFGELTEDNTLISVLEWYHHTRSICPRGIRAHILPVPAVASSLVMIRAQTLLNDSSMSDGANKVYSCSIDAFVL